MSNKHVKHDINGEGWQSLTLDVNGGRVRKRSDVSDTMLKQAARVDLGGIMIVLMV